ncbi:addiction module protein [Deltaproteobacteria bacterium TL4]
MKQISASEIVGLPIQERIQLVEDIWDSIAAVPETLEIPEWHKIELDNRLESYRKNPKAGTPWAEVRRRILGEK